MSRKIVSLPEISAVNVMVAWCLLACSMKLSISSLLVPHRENVWSKYYFHSSGFFLLWLKIFVSTMDIKILAQATASLCPLQWRMFGGSSH